MSKNLNSSSVPLIPPGQECDLSPVSVSASDSPCLKTEALIMMHILSASHCGGRWFRPGLTHRQDCQLPVPFFLAGLPGLVSFAIAKISEGLIFFTETFHKRYIFQNRGHGFLAKGRTRRYDQMCAGESIQINYVFFVIMS